MSFIDSYLIETGRQSHDLMSVYLYKLLLKRFQDKYDAGFAKKLAIGVIDYIFCQESTVPDAQAFAVESKNLIASEAEKLAIEEFVSVPLTAAIYNFCYGKFLSSGHKIGLLFHPFIGFVRSLNLVLDGREPVSFLESWYSKVGYENVKPLVRLCQLGIYRKLPDTPDSKVLMERITDFGAYNGFRVDKKNEPEKNSQNDPTRPEAGLIRRGLSEISRLDERSVVPTSKKARVLVCDDQEPLVEAISAMLVVDGYEVRSTLNSLEAIEIAPQFQPDVALIGEIMPRMDGFQLATEITRLLPQTKIVLTAEAEPSDLEIFREKGWPYDILICPFEKEELLEKTSKWVSEARFHDLKIKDTTPKTAKGQP